MLNKTFGKSGPEKNTAYARINTKDNGGPEGIHSAFGFGSLFQNVKMGGGFRPAFEFESFLTCRRFGFGSLYQNVKTPQTRMVGALVRCGTPHYVVISSKL